MALSNLDRELLQSCLSGEASAWEELTERFLGLIVHVVNYTAASRNIQITPESRDDLVAEVFYSWVDKDFAALRRFRGNSSLATYLTVIARRVVIRRLSQLRIPHPLAHTNQETHLNQIPSRNGAPTEPLVPREEFGELEPSLSNLSANEATAIRMFHADGRSYAEISQALGIAANSVGPMLTRAREKIRKET